MNRYRAHLMGLRCASECWKLLSITYTFDRFPQIIETRIVSSQDELDRFFTELEQKLISVEVASKHSGLAEGHIRYLLQRKKLSGVKLGRDWWTTLEAVDLYLKTERRPGPKTD
jgi:hypothetical protein